MSVGRSLKASLDYLGGTIGGAIYGAVVGVLVGGGSEVALLAGLAIAVGPLALIAAMRQGLTAAPITAAIVLVVPSLTNATPIASAVDRVLEVALGAVIGTHDFVRALPVERLWFGDRSGSAYARSPGPFSGRAHGRPERGSRG
jgi:hypothetical protein